MTPDELHKVQFRKPPVGQRGYDESTVDGVLDRIEETLRGQPRITRVELSELTFPRPRIGKRGYREADVDALIQRVISEWPVWS